MQLWYFILSSVKMHDPKKEWESHQFPSLVYECREKNCRQSAFPATSLYFWNGGGKHDPGWYCSTCLSWKNVETVELVTRAGALIMTLRDKTEASKAN